MNKKSILKKRKFTYQILIISLLVAISFSVRNPILERNAINASTSNLKIEKRNKASRKIASLPPVHKNFIIKNKLTIKANQITKLEKDLQRYYPKSKIKITKQKEYQRNNITYSQVLVEINGQNKILSYNALIKDKTGEVVNKWNQSYPESFAKESKMKLDIRDYGYRE